MKLQGPDFKSICMCNPDKYPSRCPPGHALYLFGSYIFKSKAILVKEMHGRYKAYACVCSLLNILFSH